MTKLLFDIEATGLLRANSQIHCIVIRDIDKPEEVQTFDTVNQNVDEGVALLQTADKLVGHNIASYDVPLLLEHYSDFKSPPLLDTLILSRVFFSTLTDSDFRAQYIQRDLPKKLYGSHSLKAWGIRLGEYKGDFAETNDWAQYTSEMKNYCIQDTLVNYYLYIHLLQKAQPYIQ